ncbi:DUF6575 domain-containing protein, partial [Vibrio anguillarum]|uniref:DUF6575 domain-containing protein n=1 Tax=Vibrio anguillarum TaxID=55601 RepID=UPI003013A1FD
MKSGVKTHVELIGDAKSSDINLPPVSFSIEPDEIQSIAPESKWDFNLKIAKKSSKSNPDRSVVSRIFDAFSELVESLMNDDSKSEPRVYPLTAAYGSFDVKLSTNHRERAAVAVEQLG